MSNLPFEDDRTRLAFPTAKAESSQRGQGHAGETNDNALPPGTRILEFEIIAIIGIGGFGIVYRAYDHSLNCAVALKEYLPLTLAARTTASQVSVRSDRDTETFQAGLRSFINEARLLAQFDHPSLVKVHRLWESNGTAYMVMQLYEGLTLKQTLHAMSGPPDETWLKELLAPLLDALDTIHKAHCFHRDIAPDNILMLDNGRPVLLDFGAARRAIAGMNQAFTVILKPGYAPIEQYAEIAGMQQGPWTDFYALGAVVFYAITGSPPLPSVSRMITDQQVLLERSALGRYTGQFLRAIDCALAVQPKDRPQSAAAFREALHLEKPSDPPVQRRSIPGSAKFFVLAGAAITIGLGVLGHILTRPSVVTPVAGAHSAQDVPARSGTAAPPVVANAPALAQPNAPAATPPIEITPRATPSAATSTEPQSILDQIYDARDQARSVTVLTEKAQVRIGTDFMKMTVSSQEAGYVYLLMVGTDHSEFTLLFPNPDDRKNRIGAGKSMSLPRTGWHLQAAGPPGTDRFVVIVSALPRQFKDAGLKQGASFAEFPPDVIARATPVARGAAPVFAGKPLCAARTPCVDSYGAARFSIEEVPAQRG